MAAPDNARPALPGLIDPQALARLRGVSLRARAVVDGVLQGLHKSPHQGASIEFAEHKEYTAGDEIKHIDWKAYGRLDRYYVKKFEHETNLQAFFVVDASASMGYGADGVLTKFEYAATLITALGWLLLRQQDAIGLVKYDENVTEVLPPRARGTHLAAIGQALEATKVQRGTNLEPALSRLVEFSKKRGMVFVLSDFFGDAEKPFKMMRNLVGRGHDVTVFQVLDGDELTFPFREMTLFEGMESPQKLLVEPELVRREYLQRMKAHQATIREAALDAQAGYQLVDTREPVGETVLRFLRGRRWIGASRVPAGARGRGAGG
ncbi:MAG: DUF58 domain-containing protein [Myxococcota bacterium]